MEEVTSALIKVSDFFKVMAWAVGISGFLLGFYLLSDGGTNLSGIVAMISGVITAVFMVAFSYLIKLFLIIEANTRKR